MNQQNTNKVPLSLSLTPDSHHTTHTFTYKSATNHHQGTQQRRSSTIEVAAALHTHEHHIERDVYRKGGVMVCDARTKCPHINATKNKNSSGCIVDIKECSCGCQSEGAKLTSARVPISYVLRPLLRPAMYTTGVSLSDLSLLGWLVANNREFEMRRIGFSPFNKTPFNKRYKLSQRRQPLRIPWPPLQIPPRP
jgi:hypothetical protein